MENQHLKRAVALLGTQAAVADACGVTQQTVSHWILKSRPVPAEAALKIEDATSGKILRGDLRPDLFAAK